jgi:preprotein translocase subunit YajC
MKKFCTVLMLVLMTACVCTAADDKKASDGFEPAGAAGNVTAAPAAAPVAADAKAAVADAKAPADAKDAGKTGEQPAGEQPKSMFDNSFIFILLGVMVLMIFMSSRSRKKQEKKRRELIDSLKKGDKVVTIGGICGVIVESKPTEIVVKVDDNTKIKFARWAVRAAGEEVADEKKKDSDDQQTCCTENNA